MEVKRRVNRANVNAEDRNRHSTDHSSHQSGDYAIEFAHRAETLGFERTFKVDDGGRAIDSSAAIEAKFVTPQDPIVLTADGSRLPAIPVDEAVKLNRLRDLVDGRDPAVRTPVPGAIRESKDGTLHGRANSDLRAVSNASEKADAPLREAVPVSKTNPLFPPLPLYGPDTFGRSCHAWLFRLSAAFGSFGFLLVVLLGAIFTAIPNAASLLWQMMLGQNPAVKRPFYEEERRREHERQVAAEQWEQKVTQQENRPNDAHNQPKQNRVEDYPPTEGGKDPLICDTAYYARRVGLDIETYEVQTEDGFVIDLLHVYNPREYTAASKERRGMKSPDVFKDGFVEEGRQNGTTSTQYKDGDRRYPVLLMHGLLQSAGAYCCNDDDSLAFYLAKAGFDVWLGNNRCGFEPRHVRLQYGDPRMWAWNIRQMGVMDLPALVSRVLEETGFEKLGLVCHSQGTTQTMVALAREQRPDIGERISIFCGLAPAAYSGPLIKKGYFKFMSILTPGMFRLVFGIHSFIPLMMVAHKIMPSAIYGDLGYLIFSFLFDWSDDRWDSGIKRRMFQFAPVYVSAESMRWWLGRDCFAKQTCILSTREEGQLEDEEDDEEQDYFNQHPEKTSGNVSCHRDEHNHEDRGKFAWYDEHAPPMAFWVGGADNLVDGRRLLRRFERGREPHVDIVHKKIIENYEHLDVIWAMDVVEKVSKEIKEILWKTAPAEARQVCRTPEGCENTEQWTPSRRSADNGHTVVERSARGPEDDENNEKAREEEELPSP